MFKLTKEFLFPVQALGMDIINQILDDYKKAREVEWLYRKTHYLKRINKRLGEQLLDLDKRNIHIKPEDWKKICGKAKKYDKNSELNCPVCQFDYEWDNIFQNQKLRELTKSFLQGLKNNSKKFPEDAEGNRFLIIVLTSLLDGSKK